MRVHRILAIVALAAAGFAACDLNPQPLPPGSETDNPAAPGGRFGGGAEDASFKADAGAEAPPVPADADAGTQNTGLGDGGDGGDASDASDAGSDADADADAS